MTQLEQTETTITAACDTIRTNWAALIAMGTPSGAARGGPKSAQITADDHDPTDADVDRLTRIVSLRRFARDVLNGWCRVIMEDRPVTKALPDGSDVPGMCAFLARHAQWFSGHEAATDATDELAAIARHVRRYVDPPRRDFVWLGDCPFVIDDWFCAGRVRTTGDDEAACTDCGQAAIVEWWIHVLGVIPTVTHDGLRQFLRAQFGRDVKRATIRQWVKRGVIEACGVDAAGRTLFDKGAVAYALTRRQIA